MAHLTFVYHAWILQLEWNMMRVHARLIRMEVLITFFVHSSVGLSA